MNRHRLHPPQTAISVIFALTVALLATACGGAPASNPPQFGTALPDVVTPHADTGEDHDQPEGTPLTGLTPILASSELTVGPNRLAIGLMENNQPISNAQVHLKFYFLEGQNAAERNQVRSESDATYYSEGLPVGVYVSHVSFDRPGTWGVQIDLTRPGGTAQTIGVRFDVLAKGTTPAIGAPAPPSHNRTLRDEPDLKKLTTAPDPNPDLYRLTVAEAITSGKPTAVLFATPAFCTSRTCGPSVDVLSALAKKYGGQMNFIHIELYRSQEDFLAGKPVPEVAAWGLPSEPWLFLIDRQGRIAAKFEGGLTRQELEPALVRLIQGS